MIYALKLLFVALLVCGLAMKIFRRSFKDLLPESTYRHAWRLVALSTTAAFVCKFPALFMFVYAAIAIYGAATSSRRSVGAISVYLLLATVAPPISLAIGGVANINYVLLIDQFRMLALALLLLPALRLALRTRRTGDGGIRVVDVCLVGYQMFRIILGWPHSTTTTLLRTVVESFLDVLLPYYVATRSIRTLLDLRFAAAHLAIGLIFAASIAIAECLTQHNLYSGLQTVYGVQWSLTYQLLRGGLLRVQAMTQQPILLAVAMLFAMGLWVWLKGVEWRRAGFVVGFAAIMIALVGTWSRGPWLAGGVLFIIVFALHKLPSSAVRILLVLTVIAAVVAKAVGADAAVESVLASVFGGSRDDLSTIDYRRQLLDTSLALIKQSPWFGVPNYAAQMQQLKQGEGIIDVVNSYVTIMLNGGVFGLALYLSPFLIVIQRMLTAIRRDESGNVSRGSRFAISLVAMNVACLFVIFTTSTFGILQLLLLMLVSLPAAWLAMPVEERESDPLPTVDIDVRSEPASPYGLIRSRGA